MKKLFFSAVLPFIAQVLFAQNYILQGVTGVSGPTGSANANIYQDGGALIGINTPSTVVSASGNLIGTLDVLGNNASTVLALHYNGITTTTPGLTAPGENNNAHPDFITATHTVQTLFDGLQTINAFNVNPRGQVGIGVQNEWGDFHGPTGLLMLTQDNVGIVDGPPVYSTSIAVYDGVSYSTESNPIFSVLNTGSLPDGISSASLNVWGNSAVDLTTNMNYPAFAIWDNAGNVGPIMAASGNGAIGMGTLSPVAQLDIINSTSVDAYGNSMDYLLHVGKLFVPGGLPLARNPSDYFTVANDPNIGVAIGILPTGTSTLAIEGQSSTALDLYEPSANAWTAQLRFFDNNGNLRHVITDDVGVTDNLIIHPGWFGYGNPVVEIEGGEIVDNDVTVAGTVAIGANPAPEGQGSTFANWSLSVDGQIVAKEVVVTTASWPDNVFDKNYNLKPINEVADYIAQNHHLPGIPAEKEVIQSGISLGDMNKILTQKVEELTLYTINLENRLKKLETEKK